MRFHLQVNGYYHATIIGGKHAPIAHNSLAWLAWPSLERYSRITTLSPNVCNKLRTTPAQVPPAQRFVARAVNEPVTATHRSWECCSKLW